MSIGDLPATVTISAETVARRRAERDQRLLEQAKQEAELAAQQEQ